MLPDRLRRFFGNLAGVGRPDPEAMLREIEAAAVPSPYTRIDEYRDFRAVFFGTSTPEQGQRVLKRILFWGHMWRTPKREDVYDTHVAIGEQNLAMKIMAALNQEPKEQPTETTKRKDR